VTPYLENTAVNFLVLKIPPEINKAVNDDFEASANAGIGFNRVSVSGITVSYENVFNSF
jgi:hypothetical protein